VSSERAGFTLIEMIVVVALIATLAAVVSPMVFRNVGDARSASARSQIAIFGLALDAYRIDNFDYPSTSQGLDALVATPGVGPAATNWRGPYLRRQVPLDPWERPYRYLSPGDSSPSSYDLWSLGRDGAAGGEGEDADISSWGR